MSGRSIKQRATLYNQSCNTKPSDLERCAKPLSMPTKDADQIRMNVVCSSSDAESPNSGNRRANLEAIHVFCTIQP